MTLADLLERLGQFQKECGENPQTISISREEYEHLKAELVRGNYITESSIKINFPIEFYGIRVRIMD